MLHDLIISNTVTSFQFWQSLHYGSSSIRLIHCAVQHHYSLSTPPYLFASNQRLPAVAEPAELPTVLRSGPASYMKSKSCWLNGVDIDRVHVPNLQSAPGCTTKACLHFFQGA